MLRWLYRKIMIEDIKKNKEMMRAYYKCVSRGYISAPDGSVILLKKGRDKNG